jgi:hypothetical protein
MRNSGLHREIRSKNEDLNGVLVQHDVSSGDVYVIKKLIGVAATHLGSSCSVRHTRYTRLPYLIEVVAPAITGMWVHARLGGRTNGQM